MWDFNQKTVKIGHNHNPSPQTEYMHYGAYILFSGRGAGVVAWLRPTIHASSQNSDALPTATLLGCCWFVVCVLSRCLRLAFFAFCCSQPFVGFVCKCACRLCLVTLVGEFALLLSPSACVYGGAWWVGCLGLFVGLCCVWGRGGCCLCGVSDGVFFVCFFSGCFSIRGV